MGEYGEGVLIVGQVHRNGIPLRDVVERERPSRGDQYGAARAGGQQGLDLVRAMRVVQQEQQPLPGGQCPEQRRAGLAGIRHVLPRHMETAQHVSESIAAAERRRPVATQVEVNLAVRVGVLHLVRCVQGERCLAHAGLAMDDDELGLALTGGGGSGAVAQRRYVTEMNA
ncbi:hypothetical protein O1157_16015 [Streptomyces albogriseolus]